MISRGQKVRSRKSSSPRSCCGVAISSRPWHYRHNSMYVLESSNLLTFLASIFASIFRRAYAQLIARHITVRKPTNCVPGIRRKKGRGEAAQLCTAAIQYILHHPYCLIQPVPSPILFSRGGGIVNRTYGTPKRTTRYTFTYFYYE